MCAAFRCYAASLGDCDGKPSREHYISRSVLRLASDTPTVEGMPGLPDGQYSIKSLASKILCQKHNTALSHLDAVAAQAIGALHRFDEEFKDAAGTPFPDLVVVDGDLLERWLVKVALGLCAVHVRTGGASWLRNEDALLRSLLHGEEFPSSTALAMVSDTRGDYAAPADIALHTLIGETSREMVSLTILARAVPVSVLLADADQIYRDLAPVSVRPAGVILNKRGFSANKQLRLSWKGGPGSPAVTFTRIGSMNGWAPLEP